MSDRLAAALDYDSELHLPNHTYFRPGEAVVYHDPVLHSVAIVEFRGAERGLAVVRSRDDSLHRVPIHWLRRKEH